MRFNPLPHGAHIATGGEDVESLADSMALQSPTSRGTYCNLVNLTGYGLFIALQSPTSRGTYCNEAHSRASLESSTCFNPLPHGAHIATDPLADKSGRREDASIPYLTGHILQPEYRMVSQILAIASIPYLTGHILQPGSGLGPRARSGASIPYLTGHILQLTLEIPFYSQTSWALQSPTSRGTYCNQNSTTSDMTDPSALQSPTSRGTYCNVLGALARRRR